MIPVNEPLLGRREREYVLDCLDSTWISSAGHYLNEFEKHFSAYCGATAGVACTSGTAALHLALAALGIGPGDEVIVPALTIVSCGSTVLYTGATPVLVDSDPVTGNMDVAAVAEKVSERTKAIMPVHLYGHPVDMDPLLELGRERGVKIVEDAAEAHGAEYKGRRVGGIGDAGCFSFYANKIVTTGEGGMVVTSDPELADKAARLRNLAHSPGRRFLHDMLGFNYRMTNLQAAIGLAQLEVIEEALARKRRMAETYHSLLADIDWLTLPGEQPYARSVYWMYNVVVNDGSPLTRDEIMARLRQMGVDTRSYFVPLHRQPFFLERGLFAGESYPVAEYLSERGFYLPSGLAITEEQLHEVSRCLHQIECAGQSVRQA